MEYEDIADKINNRRDTFGTRLSLIIILFYCTAMGMATGFVLGYVLGFKGIA